MSYSHKLRDPKTRVGLIWMAAPRHTKNLPKNIRTELYKIKVTKICDEIIEHNADLKLIESRILLGGLVKVHALQCGVLFGRANRILNKLNQAPKDKPKKARKVQQDDERNIIAPANFPVNLDAVGELGGDRAEDSMQQLHQDPLPDTTLADSSDPYQVATDAYSSGSSDLETDEEIQLTFPSQDNAEETNQEAQLNQPQGVAIANRQVQSNRRASKSIIDDNVCIPSAEYKSWLKNRSDIVSGEAKKEKHGKHESSLKMKCLWDMPNMALLPDLLGKGISDHYFPAQLKELWTKCLTLNLNSPPSGMNSARNARTKSSPSPSQQGREEDFEDSQNMFDGGLTSGLDAYEESQTHVPALEGNSITPASFEFGAVHKSTSLISNNSNNSNTMYKSFTNNSEGSTSSSKKRRRSSSQNNNSGLETVGENPADAEMEREPNVIINEVGKEPSFQLAKGLTPEKAITNMSPLLQETSGTQTQHLVPVPDQEIEDPTTELKTQLKTYLEGPEALQSVLFNQLAEGKNGKQVANLFSHTCVLAHKNWLKVNQEIEYDDIYIRRGPAFT